MIDEPGAKSARCEEPDADVIAKRDVNAAEGKHRRVLELRILEIRKEAEAARLEAKAARLERILRRSNAVAANTLPEIDSAGANEWLENNKSSSFQLAQDRNHSDTPHSHSDPVRNESDQAFAKQQDLNPADPLLPPDLARQFRLFLDLISLPAVTTSPKDIQEARKESETDMKLEPIFSASKPIQGPRTDSTVQVDVDAKAPRKQTRPRSTLKPSRNTRAQIDAPPAVVSRSDLARERRKKASQRPKGVSNTRAPSTSKPVRDSPRARPIAKRQGRSDAGRSLRPDLKSKTEQDRKRRPTTELVVSAFLHIGILVALAMVGLNSKPSDQLAFTASVGEEEPSLAIQTFEIQATTPTIPETPTDAMTKMDVSVQISSEVARPESTETFIEPFVSADRLGSSLQSQVSQSLLQNAPNTATTFCGVEGGGKHFVYLVDSSKSMGEAFSSARIELLRSIDALSQDQRFYVIFFDESPAFMRLSNPTEDESNSVLASPENKRLLRQWAMGVRMDPGKAPYDPLKFALNLAPDAIFLLSDGEFPAGIEQLLDQGNRVNNLFGEQRVRSIVHTIGYHSLQGEARMRRIAAQNEGQYRHVRRSQGVSRDGAAANRLRH